MVIIISIAAMLLGLWIIWRLVSINTPGTITDREPRDTTWDTPIHYQCRCKVIPLTEEARARGVILPKDFVGPTYRNTRPPGPHFWTEDEP
jgi:hypothetical protein